MKKFECNYCHEKFSGFSIYDCPNCGSGDVCQIMDDKLCGWQPKGKAEDVPRPPKYNLNAQFWRTQWSEASGAHLMEYLRAEKLQEQLNTAKKALTESEKMYQKQMDRFLNSEMNESARSHCESQLKLLFPAHKAYEALAAIGWDDD